MTRTRVTDTVVASDVMLKLRNVAPPAVMLTLRPAIITLNHWRCANSRSVTISPLVETWRLLLSDVSSAHCDGFFTSCVQLLMGAHTRKPFTGNKVWEMCIADDYKPHWDDLSELWFLGMQSKCYRSSLRLTS